MGKAIDINALTGEEVIRDQTAEELVGNDLATAEAKGQAFKDKLAQKETDKASAKAKLIAGEALTQAEADTIVL